jgi:hypothetical protein
MSYTEDFPQITPEEMRQTWRLPLVAAGTVPTGATAMVAPVYKDEQGQNHPTYPGMGLVNDVYARFGRLLPAIGSFIANKVQDPEIIQANPDFYKGDNRNLELPPLPGTEAAEKNVQDAERWAQANVPRPTPETPQEEQWASAGQRIGEAIFPIMPMKAVEGLGAIGDAARFFVPATKDVAPIAALTGGAVAVADAAQNAKDKREQAGQPLPIVPAAASTEPAALPIVPANQQTTTPAATPATDEGGLPGWEWALGTAGAFATAVFGLRYGGRGISKVADVLEHTRSGIAQTPEATSRIIQDLESGRRVDTSVAGRTTPEVPVPGPIDVFGRRNATDLTTRATAAMQNENAVLDQMVRGISASKEDGDAFIARIHQVNQDGTQNIKMEQQMRTGVSPGGRAGPSPMDNKVMIDQMTPQQRELANQYAYAKSEWDNRVDPGRGGTPMGGGQPLTLPQFDDNTLRSIIQQGNADPTVKSWFDHTRKMHDFTLDEAALEGLITKEQWRKAKQLYPNWMPTPLENGAIPHSWSPRPVDKYTGWNAAPIPAWDASYMYYDKAFREMQRGALNRDLVLKLHDFTRLNPEYRGLVREVWNPSSKSVTIPTIKGERHFEINNSFLRNSLTRNPTQMSTVLGWLNWGRQIAQSSGVGPIAMAGAKLFSPTHMIRYTVGPVATLPKQAYRGYLDRAIGTRLPYVPDPSRMVGIPATAAKDIGVAFARALHDALADSSHPGTSAWRAIAGESSVNSTRQWLANRLANTHAAENAAMGLGGSSGYGSRDLRPRLAGVQARYSGDPIGAVAPNVNSPARLQDTSPLGVVRRGTVSTVINLRNLLHDINGAILDSPNQFFTDINKTNPAYMNAAGKLDKPRLAEQMQSFLGDPATKGGSSVARGAAATGPFYNIALQGTTATVKSMRDHPFIWASSTLGPLIMGALASDISALMSGPQHLDHMQNHLTAQQKVSHITIYKGAGTDPNNHWTIPLPQFMHPIYPIVHELTHALVGGFAAGTDKATYDRLVHGISEMFSHHTSSDLGHQVRTGGVNALAFPFELAPITSAATSLLTGRQSGSLPGQVVDNLDQGKSALPLASSSSGPGIPGQEGGPNSWSKSSSDALKGALHAFFGTAADALIKAGHNIGIRWEATHDPSWVKRGLASDYSQQFAEQNRWGNLVWNKQLPMTTRGALDERVDKTLSHMKATEHAIDDIQLRGLTRAGGTRIPVVGESPVPDITDPTMRKMYITVSEQYKGLQQTLLPQISDGYKQLQVLKDTPMMADEKTRISNEIAYKLSVTKQRVWDKIEQMNDALTNMAGGRHVDLSKGIDWGKGVEQFHE